MRSPKDDLSAHHVYVCDEIGLLAVLGFERLIVAEATANYGWSGTD
jgi:hypothetical protein